MALRYPYPVRAQTYNKHRLTAFVLSLALLLIAACSMNATVGTTQHCPMHQKQAPCCAASPADAPLAVLQNTTVRLHAIVSLGMAPLRPTQIAAQIAPSDGLDRIATSPPVSTPLRI